MLFFYDALNFECFFLSFYVHEFIYIALTTTIYIYGDDAITLYVDGLKVLNSNHPNVTSTNVVSTASSLLAIEVYNRGRLMGALLSFTYGGCITDTTTWRCTGTYYPNWNKIDYDDASWPLASSEVKHKDYNTGKIFKMQEFSANCSVISYLSNDKPANYTIYCRHWLN